MGKKAGAHAARQARRQPQPRQVGKRLVPATGVLEGPVPSMEPGWSADLALGQLKSPASAGTKASWRQHYDRAECFCLSEEGSAAEDAQTAVDAQRAELDAAFALRGRQADGGRRGGGACGARRAHRAAARGGRLWKRRLGDAQADRRQGGGPALGGLSV